MTSAASQLLARVATEHDAHVRQVDLVRASLLLCPVTRKVGGRPGTGGRRP